MPVCVGNTGALPATCPQRPEGAVGNDDPLADEIAALLSGWVQAAASFLARAVSGDIAAVVVAAGTGVARLGDGGDVDGGIELTVAAPGWPDRWVSWPPLETSMEAAAGVAGVVVLVCSASAST